MAALSSISLPFLRATTLTAWEIPGLHHGFMSRAGGVSGGRYATLNLAERVGDHPTAVEENWSRWNAAYPKMRVARLRQEHGNVVHPVDADYDGALPHGDGMVTATPGIAVGIFTADCVPVLLIDTARQVVGALHAGWRGTLANIAREGVGAMVALGARAHEIRAALGPAIGICCFEVDRGLADSFIVAMRQSSADVRAGRPGKAYLDLRAIIRGQLERSGLDPQTITNVGPCTRCANDQYFSRRSAGGAMTGLQMSFVGLKNQVP
jgi:YfiH family protein